MRNSVSIGHLLEKSSGPCREWCIKPAQKPVKSIYLIAQTSSHPHLRPKLWVSFWFPLGKKKRVIHTCTQNCEFPLGFPFKKPQQRGTPLLAKPKASYVRVEVHEPIVLAHQISVPFLVAALPASQTSNRDANRSAVAWFSLHSTFPMCLREIGFNSRKPGKLWSDMCLRK